MPSALASWRWLTIAAGVVSVGCREVEAFDVEVLVEIEDAGLVAEAAAVVRRDADFLGELVEARDIVLALRREGNEARTLLLEAGPQNAAEPPSMSPRLLSLPCQ